MLKFRPISYNEGDFRTVKYIGTSSAQEGYICYAKTADQAYIGASLYTGNVLPSRTTLAGTNLAAASILDLSYDRNKYFPIYREDPDPENAGATIARNEFCIAFFGQEWEVHESCTESGYASTFISIGKHVCIGSNGKFTAEGKKNATPYVIAECIGTFGNWIRMRRI